MILKTNNTINSRDDLAFFSGLSKAEINFIFLMEEIFYHILDLFGMDKYSGREMTETLKIFPSFYCKLINDKISEPAGPEDLIILIVTNRNPALNKIKDMIDDSILESKSDYPGILNNIRFSSGSKAGMNIVEYLLEPIVYAPDNLEAQIKYILDNWSEYIKPFIERLKRGLDIFREENKSRFPPGPGKSEIISFGESEDEANFSDDTHWMPNVVMIAKSTFVWLDQLSKAYGRSITKLDQIPEEELYILSQRGINTLWLIGLWERSDASRKIKNACGNPEAASSAYSLKNYEIAAEIGGWEALSALKDKCGKAGLRLASDMVPNHTGIDSDWIQQYPDRFIQLPYSPFPGYTFSGPDLSSNPDTGIFLEDHYYDRTDAAVVFKHVDFRTGKTRYIYHGNDGTSMPWNDTAQLNYLDKEVREAVIDTIIHVASNFQVIRFDAAMTLAKKHIQRLWYPAPGQGGDIPSRAEHGLSDEEFNRMLPKEFWREVVDRIAEEAPDTLLLAEAFWMMEGFFVKTLGMHRVYNSAFMNMLKNEENREYRESIKNTLAYDPEILKRFVNFMNNPDEDTAALQFGKDDKYFGVCTMMAALPGLPMFGHGQIEGFEEKYGMEYRKAYFDENPDTDFVERHEREIFPLLKIRHLFSGADYFLLYDLTDENGRVNDNVFVWSNSFHNQHSLAAYNNSYESAAGWINGSAEIKNNISGELESFTVFQALNLPAGPGTFVYFTEMNTDLTYILSTDEIRERGIYLELPGYGKSVFLDFNVVSDTDGSWGEIKRKLSGKGTKNILREKRKIELLPAHRILKSLLTPEKVKTWEDYLAGKGDFTSFFSPMENELNRLYSLLKTEDNPVSIFGEKCRKVKSLMEDGSIMDSYIPEGINIMPEAPVMILLRILIYPANRMLFNGENLSVAAVEFSEDIGADAIIIETERDSRFSPEEKDEISLLAKITAGFNTDIQSSVKSLETLTGIPLVKDYLGINTYEGITWFKRETFQTFTWWVYFLYRLDDTMDPEQLRQLTRAWILGEEKSGCRIDKLLEL